MQTKLLSNIKRQLFHFMLLRLGLAIEMIRALTRYLKINLFYQRRDLITALADCQPLENNPPRVLVHIAHVVSVEEAQDREKAWPKIERFKNTIDGLLSSFAHCQLTIIVSTVAGRHVTQYLPQYQINCLQVQEEENCDPMFVEFRVQERLVNQVDDFDWFMLIEDDIIIHDAYFLEKLSKFNQKCGYDNAVLLPNRYEMWQGMKSYIDLTIDTKLAHNKLSLIEIEGVKFAEYTNPHAGMYCLSQSQIKYWIKSGREWRDKIMFVGPLESAATYCLLECFSLYKPHPSNLNFFEVRHYDTKYSQLCVNPSLYKLSAVKELSELELAVKS